MLHHDGVYCVSVAKLYCQVSHDDDVTAARVVVFIDRAHELLELILEKWNSLTDLQKQETAQYIIPEVGCAHTSLVVVLIVLLPS